MIALWEKPGMLFSTPQENRLGLGLLHPAIANAHICRFQTQPRLACNYPDHQRAQMQQMLCLLLIAAMVDDCVQCPVNEGSAER